MINDILSLSFVVQLIYFNFIIAPNEFLQKI